VRDPLVLSLSRDGRTFDSARVVASCTTRPFGSAEQPNGCTPRHVIKAGAPGPQYPHAAVDPAGGAMYVTFSLNKEDIWVKRLALSEL